MAVAASPTYPCGVCGRRGRADEMIFSHHTGNRYCADNFTECRKRGTRRARAATRVAS